MRDEISKVRRSKKGKRRDKKDNIVWGLFFLYRCQKPLSNIDPIEELKAASSGAFTLLESYLNLSLYSGALPLPDGKKAELRNHTSWNTNEHNCKRFSSAKRQISQAEIRTLKRHILFEPS